MSDPVPGPVASGTLSPDRQWFWDGARWIPAISPDGLWRWGGTGWQAVGFAGWPAWARPFASLAGRRTFAVVGLTVVVCTYVLWTGADLMAIAIYATVGGRPSRDQQDLIAVAEGLSALLFLIAFGVSTVAFCMWMHRAYRNLPAIGAPWLRYSPAWAAGSWFVPILSYFRPYQISREMWQVSAPGVPWTLLKWWWALWLAENFISLASARGSFGGGLDEGIDLAANFFGIAAGVLAVLVVRKITAGQEQRAPGR